MIEQATRVNLLQRFVERADSLYSLPAVAVEVLELTRQPQVDVRAMKACVERDPALTGKLLRIVNSSMFALAREVSDLQQALAMLGVKPLKLLALGFSLPKGLFAGLETRVLEHYWQCTLLKAVAARELAQAYWKGAAAEEAFIAGLLQDIGVLVLIQELGDSYLNFLDSARQQGVDLLDMEQQTLGFNHTELSARLLDHWNLPAHLVEAVAAVPDREHLAQQEASESSLPQILHLATLIAAIIVDGQHQLLPELLKTAHRYRALTVEQIDSLLDRMQEHVTLMANIFAVRVAQGESYREILARAHRQMARAAEEVMPDIVGHGDQPAGDLARQELGHAVDRFVCGLPPLAMPAERRSTRESSAAATAISPWSDPGLCGRISAAIAACRTHQHELSLLLLEIDDYPHLLISCGPTRTAQAIAAVPHGISLLCDIPQDCLQVGEARWAILFPNCDRVQAVAVARPLVDRLADWLMDQGGLPLRLTCTAGVATLATPTRHSQPEDLLEAAERCLFAARSSGGRVIKSIDVLA